MKPRFFTFVIMILVHVIFLSVNCRHLAPTTSPQQPTFSLQQDGGVVANIIGSSPPRCEHKCFGCSPCEATQVPTNRGRVNVSIQYSNYEPEGWKCKCGPTFYSP